MNLYGHYAFIFLMYLLSALSVLVVGTWSALRTLPSRPKATCGSGVKGLARLYCGDHTSSSVCLPRNPVPGYASHPTDGQAEI